MMKQCYCISGILYLSCGYLTEKNN